MKLNRIVATALFTAVLSLSGCSDPKEANESNFKVALQKWVAAKPEPYCLGLGIDGKDEVAFVEPSHQSSPHRLAYFEALAAAGVLSREELNEQIYKQRDGSEARRFDIRFTVSPDAVGLLRDEIIPGPNLVRRDVCFGSVEVVDVLNFTEPSDAFGTTTSQVKYTFRYVNVPAFLQVGALENVEHGSLGKVLRGETIEAKQSLVLTNNGWVHPSEV